MNKIIEWIQLKLKIYRVTSLFEMNINQQINYIDDAIKGKYDDEYYYDNLFEINSDDESEYDDQQPY